MLGSRDQHLLRFPGLGAAFTFLSRYRKSRCSLYDGKMASCLFRNPVLTAQCRAHLRAWGLRFLTPRFGFFYLFRAHPLQVDVSVAKENGATHGLQPTKIPIKMHGLDNEQPHARRDDPLETRSARLVITTSSLHWPRELPHTSAITYCCRDLEEFS